jgi:CDP-diacylglycerol--glycerol-3-phosphate 3-phosphatidyltransferase
MNLATKITFSRILMIIPTIVLYISAYIFPEHKFAILIATAVLFTILCLTDVIDGAVARRTNTVSDLGKFLDPLADKIVVVVMMFLLTWQSDALNLVQIPFAGLIFTVLSAVIVSRELIVGIFRAIASQKGKVIAADKLGKLKTDFTNTSVTILILAPLWVVLSWIGQIGFWISAVLTVVSGIRYIQKNRGVLFDGDMDDADKSAA